MPGEGGDDKNKGGGGGTGTATGDQSQNRGPRRMDRSQRRRRHFEEPTEFVDQMIHKFGTRERAIEELGRQAFELREARREADEEIEDLKKKLVPEDAVVLTGDEKKKWEKVKAIDLPGEKIVERVTKADELEKAKAKTDLSAKRKDVAKAAGLNGDVLDPLLDQFGLEVETKEIQVQGADGKLTPKQVAHVRKGGDANAAWEKLSDVIARDGSPLKPFAAALNTKAGGASEQRTTTGVPFPDQSGGSSTSEKSSVVDEMLKRNQERASRGNPLRAATTTAKTDAA